MKEIILTKLELDSLEGSVKTEDRFYRQELSEKGILNLVIMENNTINPILLFKIQEEG